MPTPHYRQNILLCNDRPLSVVIASSHNYRNYPNDLLQRDRIKVQCQYSVIPKYQISSAGV
jgi:hypothetical protein